MAGTRADDIEINAFDNEKATVPRADEGEEEGDTCRSTVMEMTQISGTLLVHLIKAV